MGSKTWMLGNGLGTLLDEQACQFERFVDLFSGAGSVSHFVAQRSDLSVLSVDLQRYSSVLADSIIARDAPIDATSIAADWLEPTKVTFDASPEVAAAKKVNVPPERTIDYVDACRDTCETSSEVGPIWGMYGGHYFSPLQATAIDHLLRTLPKDRATRSACLAALMTAAHRCAAAPGHLAQPLQANRRQKKFLIAYWAKDVFAATSKELAALAPRHAKRRGKSEVGDALKAAESLTAEDLCFVDPPYTGVQYSRFYHVLEVMADPERHLPEGRGRYPPLEKRPQSAFSNRGTSVNAMTDLLKTISDRGATAIVTYPAKACSNGLSGARMKILAKEYFDVKLDRVKSSFSTLGGNRTAKAPRGPTQERTEMLMLLTPKA